MKKVFYYLLLLAIPALITQESNAQAFEKGNMNVDLGLGLGVYSTTTTFTFDFFGQPITLSDEDGAASTMVPIIFEYGVSNKISIGAQIGFANYFIDNEDSTETTESVKSVDFALRFGYHFLDSDKNDLYAGIALGGSSVNWLDMSGEEFSGSGSYVSLFYYRSYFL